MSRYPYARWPAYETWEMAPYGAHGPGMMQGIAGIWRCVVNPLVAHGLRQACEGAPLEHVLRQIATAGVLTGMGCDPSQALAIVEEFEHAMYRPPTGPWRRPCRG
ncbi:MAG: hypothetical protein ACM3WT_09365 [Bacillota bacterium]